MIDFTDVLTDPELGAQPVTRVRVSAPVGPRGRPERSETSDPFTGAVTMDKASILARIADGEYVTGSILVHTQFDLRIEGDDADADILVWNGKRYLCTTKGNYIWHGFIWVIAEPSGIGA